VRRGSFQLSHAWRAQPRDSTLQVLVQAWYYKSSAVSKALKVYPCTRVTTKGPSSSALHSSPSTASASSHTPCAPDMPLTPCVLCTPPPPLTLCPPHTHPPTVPAHLDTQVCLQVPGLHQRSAGTHQQAVQLAHGSPGPDRPGVRPGQEPAGLQACDEGQAEDKPALHCGQGAAAHGPAGEACGRGGQLGSAAASGVESMRHPAAPTAEHT
jgi:hypothetical protein